MTSMPSALRRLACSPAPPRQMPLTAHPLHLPLCSMEFHQDWDSCVGHCRQPGTFFYCLQAQQPVHMWQHNPLESFYSLIYEPGRIIGDKVIAVCNHVFIASSGMLPSRMIVFQLSLFWCQPGMTDGKASLQKSRHAGDTLTFKLIKPLRS